MLTKIFNLSDLYASRYMLWYVREASVAVYVSNLPLIWPLIREFLPKLGAIVTTNERSRKYRIDAVSINECNMKISGHNDSTDSSERQNTNKSVSAVEEHEICVTNSEEMPIVRPEPIAAPQDRK